jgi:hypothetical protein
MCVTCLVSEGTCIVRLNFALGVNTKSCSSNLICIQGRLLHNSHPIVFLQDWPKVQQMASENMSTVMT